MQKYAREKGAFQVLPEVLWAGNAGSASKNKEQLRMAVQPLVSEVEVGQSCSAPSPSSIQNSCTASTTNTCVGVSQERKWR